MNYQHYMTSNAEKITILKQHIDMYQDAIKLCNKLGKTKKASSLTRKIALLEKEIEELTPDEFHYYVK